MLTLTHVDPARNMARYYSVSIQPDLFGGYAVMRQWGRIGRAGQLRADPYASLADALTARRHLVTSKRRRSYQ